MQGADAVGDNAYIPLHKGTGNQPSMHAEVVFPAQESQFGIAKLFLSFPSFPPLRRQYWLSRKHERPKGREREKAGSVNQTEASLPQDLVVTIGESFLFYFAEK